MSGIVGIVDLTSGSIDTQRLDVMCRAMSYWKPARLTPRRSAHCACDDGREGACTTALRLPDGVMLVAAGRIDNRMALATRLCMHLHELDALDDQALIGCAYLRWGESCVEELYGDWAVAVWDPRQRQLFLARDHSGNTSLYYHVGEERIAFASSRKALLALDEPGIRRIDDLFVAQMLLSWPVYRGARTAHPAIRRLPPAHSLTASPAGVAVRQYWGLDSIVEQPFTSIEEAAEGFLPVFDEAVHCRMRAAGSVAVALSGGLDSGAVAATAARLAHQSGQKLAAYTAVPCGKTAENIAVHFGDEWWLASVTAVHAKISQHRPVPAQSITPLQGLRWYLWAHDEPQYSVANAYWTMALQGTARSDGCKVLLAAQGGQAGLSWGDESYDEQAGRPKLREIARRLVISTVPRSMALRTQAAWMRRAEPWRRSLAIHPDLVRRVDAVGASLADPNHPIHQPFIGSRQRRLGAVEPGSALIGSLHAQNGAALNIDVRDPTLDVRVLSYCLSVPEHLLIDKAGQSDRMLMRAAMRTRLPEMVRMNQKRGLQAADLCVRLRADSEMMEACLEELDAGPARHYVDLEKLREAWRVVRKENDESAFYQASVVLMRSIMAGLFVNQWG